MVVGVAKLVDQVILFCAAFSATFLDDLGRPSNFRRVRPTVFLYQLYICSRNRGSGSATPWNSVGRPKVVMKSAALSRANFLASPRMEPWVRRSNSLRAGSSNPDCQKGAGYARKMALKKCELLVCVSLWSSGFVHPGIAGRHHPSKSE
jgi:hypothetical protein